MTPQELRARTQQFAFRVKRFCNPLLHSVSTVDAARQLARASAAVAANYGATCLARSHKEFVARIGVVLEEADESVFWTQYLREGGLISAELEALNAEAKQLARIFSQSRQTALRRNK